MAAEGTRDTHFVIRFPGHPSFEYLSGSRNVQEKFLEIDVLVPQLPVGKQHPYQPGHSTIHNNPIAGTTTHGIYPRQQRHRPIIHVPRMIHIPRLQLDLGIPQPSIYRPRINIQRSFKDRPTTFEFILIGFPLSILDPFPQCRSRITNTFFEFLSLSTLIFAQFFEVGDLLTGGTEGSFLSFLSFS